MLHVSVWATRPAKPLLMLKIKEEFSDSVIPSLTSKIKQALVQFWSIYGPRVAARVK